MHPHGDPDDARYAGLSWRVVSYQDIALDPAPYTVVLGVSFVCGSPAHVILVGFCSKKDTWISACVVAYRDAD